MPVTKHLVDVCDGTVLSVWVCVWGVLISDVFLWRLCPVHGPEQIAFLQARPLFIIEVPAFREAAAKAFGLPH